MTFKERRQQLGFTRKQLAEKLSTKERVTSVRTVENWDQAKCQVPGAVWAYMDLYENFTHIQKALNEAGTK